ncbi:MAG: hypothetical protein OEU46_14375 [Alphaproteobacteria bacterium]|nr:hypothetical protein [Alphaproteobacteria bacterium]
MTRELEAKLRSADGGAGRGKVERKWYADGGEKLTVRMRGLDLPDGTAVAVYFGDRAVAVLEIGKGAGHLRLESDDNIAVPAADDGEIARVLHNDVLLLSGKFQLD